MWLSLKGGMGNIREPGISGNIRDRGIFKTGNFGESLKRGILGNLYSNMILPVNFEL